MSIAKWVVVICLTGYNLNYSCSKHKEVRQLNKIYLCPSGHKKALITKQLMACITLFLPNFFLVYSFFVMDFLPNFYMVETGLG